MSNETAALPESFGKGVFVGRVVFAGVLTVGNSILDNLHDLADVAARVANNRLDISGTYFFCLTLDVTLTPQPS